jgi:branched-chain amino acid transport system substrate-binding protein
MKVFAKIPPILWFSIATFLGLTSFNIIRSYGNPNQTYFSGGNNQLILDVSNADKKQGIESFKQGDYDEAAKHFKASLNQQKNDPETLIYLNNAIAKNKGLKIAVVVPIDSNLNVAQEMLRGVAQAQDEINQRSEINGQKLIVVIADDGNQPENAKKIATELVADDAVLAVVGHNASNASLAAAPIYQKGGLVMITPTSFANNLSGLGDHIFRVVPSTKAMVQPLANYFIDLPKNPNLAICYDSQAPDNVSFKDEFLASFLTKGGKLVPLVCDLSSPNFDPQKMINQAISQGAKGLLMTPHIDRLDQVIALAQANQNQLTLLSSPTLYTIKTLDQGQNQMKGLVVSIPWHPQSKKNNAFVTDSYRYWGARVNWRTAMSYDATLAIARGLQQNSTREGLKNTLHNPTFFVSGATGTFKFSPSGDRLGSAYLAQIQSTGQGNDFVLLKAP